MEAQEAEMTMTIQVTRKETGKVEEYILTAIPEKENEDGRCHDAFNNVPQSGS